MLLLLMYLGFSFINLLAIKNIYWPALQIHIDGLSAVNNIIDSWKVVFVTYCCLLIVRIKQWWFTTAIRLDNGNFLLTHVLNGDLVKIIVKPNIIKITAVTDQEYNECYLDEAIPFLRFEKHEFCPEFLNINKPLLLHLEGELIPITVTPISRKDE
jgi:hypothetical protein